MEKISAPSPNFNERLCPVDVILLHYTDMKNAQEALEWLRNPRSHVSCHYLIDEGGRTYSVVDEAKRAWHAGESFWQGRTDLNSSSIGIELANPGHSHGYVPFPELQIEALIDLLREIQSRWGVSPSRILGHSDVAPRRKQDPGHLFPWYHLHQEGLGLWPSVEQEVCEDVAKGLSRIGYEVVSLPETILAFQRHFQPHKLDGVADEETLQLIGRLL